MNQEILKARIGGAKYGEIGAKFGLSRQVVRRICFSEDFKDKSLENKSRKSRLSRRILRILARTEILIGPARNRWQRHD